MRMNQQPDKAKAGWERLDEGYAVMLQRAEHTAAAGSETALAQAAKREFRHLEKAWRRLAEWHAGDVTSIGMLRCRHCGELLHFERTGRIPPCPRCHATVYERVKE